MSQRERKNGAPGKPEQPGHRNKKPSTDALLQPMIAAGIIAKAFEINPVAIAITRFENDLILEVNKTWQTIFGYRRDEVIGRPMGSLHLWPSGVERDRHAQELREGAAFRDREQTLVNKSGESLVALCSAERVTVAGEKMVISTWFDISARKRTEEDLRASESRFRSLFDNNPDAVFLTIPDGIVVTANRASCAMLGWTEQDLCRLGRSGVLDTDDPRLPAALEERRQTGHIQGRELTAIRKGGEKFPVEVDSVILQGQPVRSFVLMRDISERKRAENALRGSEARLIHAQKIADVGSWEWDITTGALSWSEQTYRQMGEHPDRFTPSREAFPQHVHPEDRAAFATAMDQSLAGISPFDMEFRIIRPNGEIRMLHSRGEVMRDADGRPQRMVGVCLDITERQSMEAQLRQAQKMEAIGLLAGGVAHDFNNLLNVINGYSELALQSLASNHPVRKDLEYVVDAGQRAASLTSQLLAFGRKQILHPKILDLNDVISGMSSMLRRLIRESIGIVTIAQPSLGLINADPGQIQQIVMNLAVNALDAMPHGGKLTIETANVDLDEAYLRKHPDVIKAGPFVMLAISDNGLGMNDAIKAHIFEPFFTTKETGKGTGLGLSTVYGIVRQSNGFIWVYSEPGNGTTFKIYFPRVEGEIPKIPAEGKSELNARGSETVLVVEDEASVRALACRILKDRGYTILEASDGQKALDLVGAHAGKIHLVLTDVVMPGISGSTLVSRLETARPGIKVLYISGYANNAIVHHGILDSNVAFLQKPFTVEGLARKVREAIDS